MSTPAASGARKRLRPASTPADATGTPPAVVTEPASRPAHKRQATPFDVGKAARSTRSSSRHAAAAQQPEVLLEEEEEDESEEDEAASDASDDAKEQSDADMSGDGAGAGAAADGSGSEAADDDGVHVSLAAQFEEAAIDSGSEGGDEAEDGAATTNKSAGAAAAPAAAAAAPRVPQLVAATDTELQFHLGQLHRIMKKLRGFAVTKHVRKVKEATEMGAPASALESLTSDLETVKHLNLDHLSLYSWRIYNQRQRGKKMAWNAEGLPITREAVNAEAKEGGADAAAATAAAASTPAAAAASSSASPHLRSLLSQILYSPACKKAVEHYIAHALKKARKTSSRSRKLDKIAEAAAKRKEKEKKAREKAEQKEREKKAKEAAAAGEGKEGAAAEEADDKGDASAAEDGDAKPAKRAKKAAAADADPAAAATSEDAERDAKRAEKANARREKQKAKKEKMAKKGDTPVSMDTSDGAAAAPAAAADDASSSGSSSSDDSGDETGAAKAKKAPLKGAAAKKPSRVFGGLVPGKIVDGVITGVEPFGLFIEFFYKKKERKGMCHVSMLSDAFVSDIKSSYSRGDRIQAIVTKLDERTGRISLGCKTSLFPADKPPRPLQQLSKTAVMPVMANGKGAGAGGEEGAGNGKLESLFMDSLHAPKPDSAAADPRVANIKKFLSQVSATGAGKQTTGASGKNRLGQRERRKLIASVLGAEAQHVPGKDDAKHVQAWKRKKQEREAAARGEAVPAHSTPAAAGAASSDAAPKVTSSSFSSSGENRRAKRLKMHADALAAGLPVNPLAAALVAKVASGELSGPKPKNPAAPPRPATAAASAAPRAASAAVKGAPSTARAQSHRPATASAAPRGGASTARPAASAPAPAPAPAASAEELHPSWHAKQLQAAKAAAAPQGKKFKFDD